MLLNPHRRLTRLYLPPNSKPFSSTPHHNTSPNPNHPPPPHPKPTPFRQLLSNVSQLCPSTARKFRRVSVFKPHQAFELLTAFQHGCDSEPQFAVKPEKVASLLEIFNLYQQGIGVLCFPGVFKVMGSLLLRASMFAEVENFVDKMGKDVNLVDLREIVSGLIDGYVGAGDVKRAVAVYEKVKMARGEPPLISSFNEIISHLIRHKEVQMSLQVCVDAIELGFKLNDAEHGTYNSVIRLLYRNGKIQDARNLVKKGMLLGLEHSVAVLDEIVSEYCEQANFDDVLGLFHEIRRTPSVEAGNKILHSFCKMFGAAESYEVLLELKRLNYIPDEVTYGILIGWACHYGKLKDAFFYLSEMFSSGLTPNVLSYNALIAALFKEGMCKQAHTVFLDMVDRGIQDHLSTYEVLLAGYCKARKFEEVKATIREMVDRGLIKVCLLEDPLSKAFELLGFSSLSIRVIRDNHAGLSLSEFYDELGNGLYLQTDEAEYEFRLDKVLEKSITLDLDTLVTNEISNGSVRKSLALVSKAFHWGQEVSSSTLTGLIKGVHESVSHIKSIIHLLEKTPKLYNQLNHETFNWLVQVYSKKGFTEQGALIVEVMLQKQLPISGISYSAFLKCLLKKGSIKGFQTCWQYARSDSWLPSIKDLETLVSYLLEHGMLNEALELHESLSVAHCHVRSDINCIFITKLCELGYTGVAHDIFRRMQDDGCIADENTYNNLTEGFIREKHVSAALRMYEEMCVSKMYPSLTGSASLIPHLCKSNQLDEANSLITICLQRYPSELLVIYKSLIRGLSKAGKRQKVVAKVHNMMMDGVSPDNEILNLIFLDYCQEGQLAKALEVFGALIRHNGSLEISSYGRLVYLLCKKGCVSRSLNLCVFLQLEIDYLILSNILIFYLFKTRNSSYVEKILDKLIEREISVDAVTYDYLVQGYYQCRDVFKLLKNLMTMISKDLKPSPRSLRMAISLLCEEGMLERAFSVIKEMESRGWILSSTIQYILVEELLRQSRILDAELFLDQNADKGLIGKHVDYNNLVKKFCCIGRLDRAANLVDIMLRRGSIPDSMAYESLIHRFCLVGKMDQALDFHAEMLDFNTRPSANAWDVLIQNSCKFRNAMQGEKLLNDMIQIGEVPSRKMYCSVIEKYRSENNHVKATSLLQAMHQHGYNAEFDIQWSLIRNLTNSDMKTAGKADTRFLSKLLSESGFSHSKKPNPSTRNFLWSGSESRKRSLVRWEDRLPEREERWFRS